MGDLPRFSRLSRSRDRYRVIAARYIGEPSAPPAAEVAADVATGSEVVPAAAPPRRLAKHELLTLAGDAAQAIYRHCETCTTCPEPAAFGSIVAPLGCCGDGRAIWEQYRAARAAALEVN